MRSLRRQPSQVRLQAFARALLGWAHSHGRSFPWRIPEIGPYQLVISEILLQRTQAPRVAEFFPSFVERYPSWDRLAEATEAELRTFLEPLGLWRRRATTLRELARVMKARKGKFPAAQDEIEKLPGMGQYATHAVLLFYHQRAMPLIDVNMARVLERNFGTRQLVDIRYDPFLQRLARRVVSSGDAVRINWAILDLAAMVCRIRTPRCEDCPLRATCTFGRVYLRRKAEKRGVDPNS